MNEQVDYDAEGVANTYAASRELPRETLDRWLDATARWLPAKVERIILDLGCGTGRFAQPMATRFASKVIGVDPARGMLAAAATPGAPGVHYVCALAEAIPIRDGVIDVALLSMVYHHFADRAHALQEVVRVLATGGHVVIRNATRENIEQLEWIVHFPEARELEMRRMPPRAEISADAERAGLCMCGQETVTQRFADTYGEYCRKISMRSLSVLRLISDEEFEAGLTRFRAWCNQRWDSGPVWEAFDLIVAQKV